MSVSRNTVAKYLKHPEPKRKAARKRAPVTEMVPPRIEQILSEWRGRTTPKQRITGTRTHRQLIEEGYEVGITTVRDYLREKRRQEAEVFVPLVHRPGDEAQVDFFEVTVEEGAQMKKVWKFVMRLMYSGRDFVWLYESCDQLSSLDHTFWPSPTSAGSHAASSTTTSARPSRRSSGAIGSSPSASGLW
jgi:transposase